MNVSIVHTRSKIAHAVEKTRASKKEEKKKERKKKREAKRLADGSRAV